MGKQLHTSPKKVYEQQMNTHKDAQHHLSLR